MEHSTIHRTCYSSLLLLARLAAVEARLDGKEVWRVPERLGKSTPSDAYHVWKYVPEKTNAAR